ncbi:GNAT family N-acetyltransferase [Chloroflexota bacterium]
MITNNKVKLREKILADARNDYTWQSDPELAQLDASSLLTTPFSQYLLDYTYQLSYSTSTSHRFAVETTDSKHIGNCTYYNVDEAVGEVELGIVIGDRNYWNNGYGTDAVNALVSYIFLQRSMKRVHLKTLDWNLRAQKCFKKCGFTPCGELYRDGYSFVLMELHRKQWEERQESKQL